SFAQELPQFDFTQPESVLGWQAAHDISKIAATPEGLEVSINGNDPYFIGPARDYPANTPLWMTIRLKSEQEGSAQVFYWTQAPGEEKSVRFSVLANQWVEKRIPLPVLEANTRLRIDPPGTAGRMTISSLRFAPRTLLKEPQWPRPDAPNFQGEAVVLKSGNLTLKTNYRFGQFALDLNGKNLAIGFNRPQIGYIIADKVRWIDFSQAVPSKISRQIGNALVISNSKTDEAGASWRWQQSFKAGKVPGTIEVESTVTVNQDRDVVFLPMLVIFPGAGSFGQSKRQAIFPGLEYLDNEPGSSEADIIGPESKRQVPDSKKITLPMMAVQNGDSYIGLAWKDDPQNPDKWSALFDSPDRIFNSSGHVMGLLFPGSDGENRVEGSLLPYQSETLKANKPLTLNAVIFGGKGQSAVDAVKHFVAWNGLPALPASGTFEDYNALASSGWLDSRIREGDLFRHAFWPGFAPKTATDAPLLMEWLANQNSPEAARLRQTAQSALAQVKPENYNETNVSHITYPVAALVYGGVEANAERAAQNARDLLNHFEADGSVRYQKRPNGEDYGKTHFAPDANGLTAQVVWSLLENAVFSGEPGLINTALEKLRALDKFKNTVPRGAQTWEVPLHTPDILASAHLVRAYVRGYELTGDKHFLEMARYWAWTGVPFIYLRNPTSKPVGPYSTIAVLGATAWQAPVWFGQPVQWCGLVYADALYQLLPHDPGGPWKRLADGITVAGIQHTWTQGDKERQGLLPDYYLLRPQVSAGPAINPGTLQVNAVRLFNKPALYDFRSLRQSRLLVHAPGAISDIRDSARRARFKVSGWPQKSYFVLINGLKKSPQIRINGQVIALTAPHQFHVEKGRLILQLQSTSTVEISNVP
ncbi:MAG TPA: hypothetical protein VGB77_08365, partial [Abditibacteriaceae bacterium]